MSVSVRTDRKAAELLTRPESAGDLQHWLHQHGGKDHARQQGPVQVGVDTVESPPGFVLLPFFKKKKIVCFCVSKEIREGGRQLLAKLQKYTPLIAAFNGKGGVFLSI